MARGRRKDSASELVKLKQRALAPMVEPPMDVAGTEALSEFGMTVYTQLFRMREHWSTTDLMTAVQLAACSQEINEVQATLAAEGHVIEGSESKPSTSHPLVGTLSSLRNSQQRLIRSLGVRRMDSDRGFEAPIDHTATNVDDAKFSFL